MFLGFPAETRFSNYSATVNRLRTHAQYNEDSSDANERRVHLDRSKILPDVAGGRVAYFTVGREVDRLFLNLAGFVLAPSK